YSGVCSNSDRHALSSCSASSTLDKEKSGPCMDAKVISLADYRHNSTLKTPVSGREINEAFRWIRSWMISSPVCPATHTKITKIGITNNKKGGMLLINFFIFLSFYRSSIAQLSNA